MATITFLLPDGNESPFELSGELTVGREAGNDVVLPEGGLSRKHCRFYEEAGQVYVEDLGSSNGTFVEGERIAAPTPVSEGQEILVANIQVNVAAAARPGAPRRQPSAVRRSQASSARTGAMVPAAGKARPTQAIPTAGAKGRPASGSGRPSSAVARRGGSAPAVSDPGEDAGASPSARAVLKGMTGPWAGKRYPLSKIVSVVGRVEGNDVVVEDDSVSRRHAEIRKSGPGYAVRDLNSANGTFVNGERITEAPLRPGDVLKFGVVEFGYSGPSLGKSKGDDASGSTPEKRKKLLMFGGGGVVAILLLAVIAHELATPPAPVQDPSLAANTKDAPPDVQQLLGMCRSFSDVDGNTLDWARAVEKCDAVIKLDPINQDARKLRKLSETEMGQKKIFDHAHDLYSQGQEEAALDEYAKLDNGSFYFAQARAEYRKASDVVKKRLGDQCVLFEKSGQYDKAWIACKQYEDFASYRGSEEKYQKIFAELSKRYKNKDEWVKPTKYARFLQEVVTNNGDKRFEEIKKLYSDPDLANAVNVVAKDPVAGRTMLQKYRDSGKDAARAQRIIQFADALYSKHQSAYEKALHNDLKGAAEDIRREIDADHGFMPKDYETDPTEKDRESIADKYAEQAKLTFQQQRYEKSFQLCDAGGEFTKASIEVNQCYADLENYANSLGLGDCGSVDQVMKITRPASLIHKKADEARKQLQCP